MTRLGRESTPISYAVIGAAMRVHSGLGSGYLESAYQEALAYEFEQAGLKFSREAAMPIRYRDIVLACRFRADFLVEDQIVVELKAVQALAAIHEAQLLHYLRSSGHKVGLLLNFGEASLAVKRLVNGEGPFFV